MRDVLVDAAGFILLSIDHVEGVIFGIRSWVRLVPKRTNDIHFVAELEKKRGKKGKESMRNRDLC